MATKRIKDLLSAEYDKDFRIPVDNELSGTHYITLEQIKNNSGSGGGFMDGTLLKDCKNVNCTTEKSLLYTVENNCQLVLMHSCPSNYAYNVYLYIGDNGSNPLYFHENHQSSSGLAGWDSFSIPIKAGTKIYGSSQRGSSTSITFYEYKLS